MADDQTAWPREIYSAVQVRGFDRRAIDEFGIDAFELMQRASAAALDCLRTRWPEARSVLIYCGTGNNAGDGYVLAALATAAGLAVTVVAVGAPESLRGEAAEALSMAREAAVAIVPFPATPAPAENEVIVDALLGTGLTRDLEGVYAQAVAAINESARPVLALDVPTGLDADTGQIRGVAVRASATITFVGLKQGLYLGAGPAQRGALAFSDLGCPAAVFAHASPTLRRLDASDCARLLKPRSRLAHKGSNGRVLIVGGGAGMAGAARLAAEAALRAGAGLIDAAVAPSSLYTVMAGRPEIMAHPVEHGDSIEDLVTRADVIVVGPGLGRTRWGEGLAQQVLEVDKPLVVDADALNYLAGRRRRRNRWVLTPHPGEAGRLLDLSAARVQAARDAAVAALAREFGAVAVLKGNCSLISEVTENKQINTDVCDYGNPGMATAGTGDVLAGVIGGLIAQFGLSRDIVALGVLVHALAGDDAAADGERGMVASDLLAPIRRRVNPI